MVESVMIAILIIDIAMLLISISCLKDVIRAESRIEKDLKAIRILHRYLEIKKAELNTERIIYPQKEDEQWD